MRELRVVRASRAAEEMGTEGTESAGFARLALGPLKGLLLVDEELDFALPEKWEGARCLVDLDVSPARSDEDEGANGSAAASLSAGPSSRFPRSDDLLLLVPRR